MICHGGRENGGGGRMFTPEHGHRGVLQADGTGGDSANLSLSRSGR